MNETLREAALALYMAGRWSLPRTRCINDKTPSPQAQAKMWEDLRDALDLEPGTATRAGVNG